MSGCTGGVLSPFGPYGCYNFYDSTNGEYLQTNDAPMGITKPVRNPTVIFSGLTFESIAEKNAYGSLMTDYGSDWFTDHGYDYHGTYHDVFSDPWIFLEGVQPFGQRGYSRLLPRSVRQQQ